MIIVTILFALAIPIAMTAYADPNIDATKDDNLIIDNDGDGVADPGDTIRYTVVITNSGNMDATSVDLSDTIDFNTTLVAGSLKTTPIARDDNYNVVGNVSITVTAGSGLLINDNDPDGGLVTVVPIVGGTSSNGGDVDVAADGSFTYDPPPGFEGIDTFSYTVQDSDAQTDPATVIFAVSGMIWFVDASASCPCDGRLSNPFTDLAVTANSFDVNAADAAGDNIYLADGSYNGGLALLNNQRLIGDGSSSDLATVTGISVPPLSAALPTFSGTDPMITSTANGINLGANNTIRGLTVGNTPSGTGMAGTTVGTLAVSEVTINGSGGGLDINGGTLAVALDSLSASSSTDEGISLVNVSGSLTVSAGTISTTGVPGVKIDGNPLGLSVTFDSISASGGANGIVLMDTTGSFTVTGDGSTAGSGGTIQNMTTGADNTGDGIGVSLSNVQNISFSFMQLNDFSNYAVRGNNVTGFTFSDSTVNGNNGNSDAWDEGSVRFTNLLGSATISASNISGGHEDNVRIDNNTGTLDRLTISNGTTIGANSTNFGNDGVFVVATVSATVNVTVTNSIFNSSRGDLIQLVAEDSSTMDWIITNNTFENSHSNISNIVSGGGGLTFSGGDNSTVTYDISDNTMRDALGIALNVFMGTGGSANWNGTIDNNDIGVSSVAGSGSEQAHGINVEAQGSGTHTTAITNNTIFQFGDRGIQLLAVDGNGTLNATVTGNTIAEPFGVFPQEAIYVQAGASSTLPDSHTLCADITGNTFDDFRIRQRISTTINLPGYAGGSADTGAVVTFVQENNTGIPIGSATVSGSGGGFTGTGTDCVPESFTMLKKDGQQFVQQSGSHLTASLNPTGTQFFVNNKPENLSAVKGDRNFRDSLTSLVKPLVKILADVDFSSINKKAAVVVSTLADILGPSPAYASGETINLSLGDMNPVQVVVITFDVTVNTSIPSNVTEVCNQAIFTGDNIADLITDDPDVGGANDPTCTSVPQPDTTPPSLIVPPDVTVEIGTDTSPATTGAATATDNGGPPTINFSDVVLPGTGSVVNIIHRTWTATDGVGNTASAVQIITVVNRPPEVEATPVTQDVQYSDLIASVTVTVTDHAADTLSASTEWSSDGGSFMPGLPDSLSLAGPTCATDDGDQTCIWTISGAMGESEGTYTVRITGADNGGGASSTDVMINVSPEDATAAFDESNPVSVEVDSSGGDSGLFSLTVYVTETQPDEPISSTAPGDISLAKVAIALEPVGPGSPHSGTCHPDGVTGTGYGSELTVTCSFDNVPVNTYSAIVTVNFNGYYSGTNEDVLIVFDPSLGFTTGGGWFYWPGTDDRTTFGYIMKYNRKGMKVKGNLLVIRHLGDGSIFRVRSNALFGLSIGEVNNSESFGWATFSGKATFYDSLWFEPVGNHTFMVYVEDYGEPGAGADRFWIEVGDQDGNVVSDLSMAREATEKAVTIEGGNIVVPHNNKGRRRNR
jgi:uncharacterized repeat protein (TIGR01451 family)